MFFYIFIYIHYTKIVKDIKYPELFCVVDICYTCTHSIYELHKKLRIFNILNTFCVVYIYFSKKTFDLHFCERNKTLNV